MNSSIFSGIRPEQIIVHDLVNSFLVEGFITTDAIYSRSEVVKLLKQYYHIDVSPNLVGTVFTDDFAILMHPTQTQYLCIPLEKSVRQQWKMHPKVQPYRVEVQSERLLNVSLNAIDFFDEMQNMGCFKAYDANKLATFRDDLIQAQQHSEYAQQHQIQSETWPRSDSAMRFIQWEQYAALRDRPFHPLAKLKDGFSREEYQCYSPEFAQPMLLNWVMVNKAKMVYGQDVTQLEIQQPAKLFLTSVEYLVLQAELQAKKIDKQDYIAMPMHAWQFQHVLNDLFAQELLDKTIIALQFQSEGMYASSSLRSLLYPSKLNDSLKLPLAVASLGSMRYLPIVKFINGQKNQALFQAAKQRDPILKQRLWLCDENQWWGYLPQNPQNLTNHNLSLFEKNPMQLAAQRRRIPTELLNAPYQIIPMASLGQLINGQACIFDLILDWQKLAPTDENVMQSFGALCLDFFDIILRFLRLGLMPEIHGQNVCVVLKAGQYAGFMLRDHDSLRIHLDTMQQHGLQDPDYLSPQDFRITLYHDDLPALLTYLQTLGIQVNLASILESLAEHYNIEETRLWQVLKTQLDVALNNVPFEASNRKLIYMHLFKHEYWPFKELIRPLLAQDNRVGSMPSSFGQIRNIFHDPALMLK